MARIDVQMPQMGESIAEGTLSRWLKKLGDEVKRDEPMFEISTDKVDAEISASDAGTIAEILVKEGQTVPVGAVVARLETTKGAVSSTSSTSSGAGADVPGTGVATPAVPTRTLAQPAAGVGNGDSFEERIRTRSSPLVRRMAADAGVAIATLTGTGIAGRVTRRDLVAYLESGVKPAASPPAPGGAHAPAFDSPMPLPWPGDVVEPMSRMRQLTAEHMVVARRTAMHVTTVFEEDLTRVARIRAARKAEF